MVFVILSLLVKVLVDDVIIDNLTGGLSKNHVHWKPTFSVFTQPTQDHFILQYQINNFVVILNSPKVLKLKATKSVFCSVFL